MDMWSDTNLTPFMAVTAHWIETTTVQTPQGPQHILKLRSDLIGFQRCPGRHTGEHLAQAFLHVLKRIKITSKVWEILSSIKFILIQISRSAGNNNTFMTTLAAELRALRIPFDAVKRRIR